MTVGVHIAEPPGLPRESVSSAVLPRRGARSDVPFPDGSAVQTGMDEMCATADAQESLAVLWRS